ncbi:GTP-binding protein Rho3 [Halteromyces radiatus]|uniref:GTP-binding protein Rho3 n=1 Tax=Halteromyces radiatus TaxID=101107 RepID=UPI0022208B15|nr:GTP-binding protein Rho3 [Halteromyces radiatus]KAI8099694.1 GTP-binding protein Rho3 [Halteromyces radiatus]
MGFCGEKTSNISVRRKLVVVGDGNCGKSSLLNVFTKGIFPQVYEPTVFENYVHEITVDGRVVEFGLWDTAGQEEYDRLRTLSYENTNVVLLCFSVDNPVSLDNILERWIPEICDHCAGAKLMLVALKCDLRDEESITTEPIMYEQGVAMARHIAAVRYLECSAKHNRGVREVFEQAARVAMHDYKARRSDRCTIS